MPDKSISNELRELISSGGPPYDPKKVMAWFNREAPAMLVEIQALEQDFVEHHLRTILTDETRAALDAER